MAGVILILFRISLSCPEIKNLSVPYGVVTLALFISVLTAS